MTMRAEIERRQNATEQVLAIFRAAPCRWIHWRRFEAVTPCSWRTRISNARAILKAEGGVVENNHSITRSAYRYLPYVPLGRDASEPTPRTWTTDGPFTDDFKLTP